MLKKLTRYFVAIDAQGAPVYQRASARGVTYLSADKTGSFSKRPPTPQRPLRVIEVAHRLEWRASAPLPSGALEVSSGQCGVGGNVAIRYTYRYAGTSPNEARGEAVSWSYASLETFHASKYRQGDGAQVVESAPVTKSLKNWPQPAIGDSLAGAA